METARGESGRSSQELEWICRTTLQAAHQAFREAHIEARFHPYVGLTHTIRRSEEGWVLRISDHCRRASRAVLEAIALLLAAKVLRRAPPKRAVEEYARFKRNAGVTEAVRVRRLERGRKMIGSGEGKHHSLSAIYREVNARYFGNRIEIRRLGWGARRSWRRLGHYDPAHHSITVSPVLDSATVPRDVVAYIVYHEMLHTLFECDDASRVRNRHHSPGFKWAERAYPDCEAARRFLESFCRHRGK